MKLLFLVSEEKLMKFLWVNCVQEPEDRPGWRFSGHVPAELLGSLVCEVWHQNRMGCGAGVCASGHTGHQDSLSAMHFTLSSKKVEFTPVGLIAPPQGSLAPPQGSLAPLQGYLAPPQGS